MEETKYYEYGSDGEYGYGHNGGAREAKLDFTYREPEEVDANLGAMRVINYMAGISYRMLDPLVTLMMIVASFIRGEGQYYRNKDDAATIFDKHVRDALDYDFEGTLKVMVRARKEYNMRLNPQVIAMMAAVHPGRAVFNQKNPKVFADHVSSVILIPTDMKSQLDYFLRLKGGKAKLPGCMKRIWARKLEGLSAYHANKYKSKAKLLDLIRISHPRGKKNPVIDELVKTGDVEVKDDQVTWENLKSQGKTWAEIIEQIRMPHMALLRNLCGIVRDPSVSDESLDKQVSPLLKAGVPNGKQFPFRYYSAWTSLKAQVTKLKARATKAEDMAELLEARATKAEDMAELLEKQFATFHESEVDDEDAEAEEQVNPVQELKERLQEQKKLAKERLQEQKKLATELKTQVPELEKRSGFLLQALENCMTISLENFPKLTGRTISLTDNSASARDTITSEYGSVKVSTIANLSGLITAMNSEKGGTVGTFGDNLFYYDVDKKRGILEQLDEIERLGEQVGGGTENGIWIFFRESISRRKVYDNVFIYSDEQAGHGGLYGVAPSEYSDFRWKGGRFIDVLKLVENYRQVVNPKVNVFSVQVAGYNNSVLPENTYRTSVMQGWTGKEVPYAVELIKIWDQQEAPDPGGSKDE